MRNMELVYFCVDSRIMSVMTCVSCGGSVSIDICILRCQQSNFNVVIFIL